jgi:hypothetical protein
MDLKETECEYVDWNQPIHDRIQWRTFASTVMNHRGFLEGEKFPDQLRDYQLPKLVTMRLSDFGNKKCFACC